MGAKLFGVTCALAMLFALGGCQMDTANVSSGRSAMEYNGVHDGSGTNPAVDKSYNGTTSQSTQNGQDYTGKEPTLEKDLKKAGNAIKEGTDKVKEGTDKVIGDVQKELNKEASDVQNHWE